MEILILKDGEVIGRARDADNSTSAYTVQTVLSADIPDYPETPAGVGKYYDLGYVDGVLSWVTKSRPLTQQELVSQYEEALNVMGVEVKE